MIIFDGFVANVHLVANLKRLGWELYQTDGLVGTSSAKNFGIKKLLPDIEFVTFLDADDVCHPKHFELCLKAHSENRAASIGSQAVIFKFKLDSPHYKWIFGHPRRPTSSAKISRHQEKNRVHSVYASHVIRKKVLDEIGQFDVSLKRGEDFDFFKRIISKGHIIKNLNSQLYAYQHPIFDDLEKYKMDNSIRGQSNNYLFRYFRNCFLRILSLPIKTEVKNDWKMHFIKIAKYVSSENLITNFGLK